MRMTTCYLPLPPHRQHNRIPRNPNLQLLPHVKPRRRNPVTAQADGWDLGEIGAGFAGVFVPEVGEVVVPENWGHRKSASSLAM